MFLVLVVVKFHFRFVFVNVIANRNTRTETFPPSRFEPLALRSLLPSPFCRETKELPVERHTRIKRKVVTLEEL